MNNVRSPRPRYRAPFPRRARRLRRRGRARANGRAARARTRKHRRFPFRIPAHPHPPFRFAIRLSKRSESSLSCQNDLNLPPLSLPHSLLKTIRIFSPSLSRALSPALPLYPSIDRQINQPIPQSGPASASLSLSLARRVVPQDEGLGVAERRADLENATRGD